VSDPTPLAQALQIALLRELLRTWEHLDRLHFRGAMRAPTLDLSEDQTALAVWRPEDRTISFSLHLIAEQPWTAVVEVLRHEMAHQYVTDVLKVRDEPAHGAAFQRVCAERGIDPGASGLPAADPEGERSDRARVVRRIQKLLALGDSPNEHEAAAAMQAAQRLMLEHNIAWAKDAAHAGYGFRQLGEPRLKILAHQRILAGILADHFFVHSIWVPAWIPSRGKRGRVLEISGSKPNLDTADYVHAFLLRTAKGLWKEWKEANPKRLRGERGRYLLGVMLGFREKLQSQRRVEEETGLVWVGDAALDDFVGRRHPNLRSTRAVRYRMTPAYQHGHEQGKKLQIHAGVGEDPEERPRQLEG